MGAAMHSAGGRGGGGHDHPSMCLLRAEDLGALAVDELHALDSERPGRRALRVTWRAGARGPQSPPRAQPCPSTFRAAHRAPHVLDRGSLGSRHPIHHEGERSLQAAACAGRKVQAAGGDAQRNVARVRWVQAGGWVGRVAGGVSVREAGERARVTAAEWASDAFPAALLNARPPERRPCLALYPDVVSMRARAEQRDGVFVLVRRVERCVSFKASSRA